MRYYRPDRFKPHLELMGAYAFDARHEEELLRQQADKIPQNKEAIYFFNDKAHAELKQLFSYTGKIGGTITAIKYVIDNNAFITPVVTLQMVVENVSREVDVILDQLDLWTKDVTVGDQIILLDNPPKRISIYMIHKKFSAPNAYELRTTCPVCHRESIEVNHKSKRRCINPKCYGVLKSTLKKINSGDGHNLGLRWSEIERLMRVCSITTASDLLKVDLDILRKAFPLDSPARIQEKESRIRNKNIPLESKIYSLNIPGVRFDLSKIFARHYRSIERMLKTTSSELKGFKGSSLAMYKFLTDAENVEEITKYILLTR